ncbi:metallophosphoesterase [Pedobacter sp. N23S346]|uniref:metallophosphoesterase n=1 Tax=Pedobacter sp. N23S346 TaxID=3402750 RepID=UPI003ACFBB2E
MKIQFLSDLHMECYANKKMLKASPIVPKAEILLMAGDIMPLKDINRHLDLFSFLSDNYKQVYWVPGNHEFYGTDLSEYQQGININIKENINLLKETKIIIERCEIIFTTLWSRISNQNSSYVAGRMPDFSYINFNGKPLTVGDYNLQHTRSVAYLDAILSTSPGMSRIVVSHHAPTFVNYPDCYKESKLNEAFATELLLSEKKWKTDYWIFGHHHQNVDPFNVKEIKMRCNQMGYVHLNEEIKFMSKLAELDDWDIIEI